MQAAESVGYRHLRLDEERQNVALTVGKMQLDLGGIAKGYAADQALRSLREAGVASALVNASGDIAIGNPPPDLPGWKIGVAPLDADRSAVGVRSPRRHDDDLVDR